MMVKVIFALLIAMLLGACAFAQAEPDWLKKDVSKYVDETKEGNESVLPVPDPVPTSPLDDLLQRAEDAIKRANDAADMAEKAANKANAVKMPEPVKFDFDTEARLKALEDAVSQLQARKEWTEGEIRTLAKDEAEKVMKATVKSPDGTVREVGASSMQVTVAGYSGTFEVKPGERIVAVNGQPIVQRAVMSQRVIVNDSPMMMQSTLATTPTVQMQSVPQRQGVVRFWSLPRANNQCVGGNCPR